MSGGDVSKIFSRLFIATCLFILPPVSSHAESTDSTLREDPTKLSVEAPLNIEQEPEKTSAEYVLKSLAGKQRKWRRFVGPGLLVLGGIIIATPNEGNETTSYVAGGLSVGLGLHSLIFPWPAEKGYEKVKLIGDPEERELAAYQSMAGKICEERQNR